MEHAHRFVFFPDGASLHNRRQQYLCQPASGSVYDHCQDKPGKGILKQLRHICQAADPHCRHQMGRDHAFTVADPVRQAGSREIQRDLSRKIYSNERGYLSQRYPVFCLKSYKQQGRKSIDHGLDDISDGRSAHSMAVIHPFFHLITLFCFSVFFC